MKFSLIHPSRGRPQQAAAAHREWSSRASGRHDLEYLLSIDADDPVREAYAAWARAAGLPVWVAANRSLVDAVNRAAREASGEVLVVVSDDFGCPQDWDASLAAVIGDDRDLAVQVHDGGDGTRMTLPILGRRYYERLGHIYHPAYFSLFADDELTERARLEGRWRDARHLVFPHRHYSYGLSECDATYRRQNSNAAWWGGWRTFEKRRATGFGRQPRTPRVLWKEARVELRYWSRRLGSRLKRALRPSH